MHLHVFYKFIQGIVVLPDVKFEEFARSTSDCNGAQLKLFVLKMIFFLCIEIPLKLPMKISMKE